MTSIDLKNLNSLNMGLKIGVSYKPIKKLNVSPIIFAAVTINIGTRYDEQLYPIANS